jgi:hypothetical protein
MRTLLAACARSDGMHGEGDHRECLCCSVWFDSKLRRQREDSRMSRQMRIKVECPNADSTRPACMQCVCACKHESDAILSHTAGPMPTSHARLGLTLRCFQQLVVPERGVGAPGHNGCACTQPTGGVLCRARNGQELNKLHARPPESHTSTDKGWPVPPHVGRESSHKD